MPMLNKSPMHLAVMQTNTIGIIYVMFPVVSTRITLKEKVILDWPVNMPQAPRKANLIKIVTFKFNCQRSYKEIVRKNSCEFSY